MKIKLDENLPERLVSELAALGHYVDTVRTERLTGRTDDQVWPRGSEGRPLLVRRTRAGRDALVA